MIVLYYKNFHGYFKVSFDLEAMIPIEICWQQGKHIVSVFRLLNMDIPHVKC